MVGRGGPGRLRSQRDTGMVKINHQSPTRKRTIRRGSEVLLVIFRAASRIIMQIIWTRTAAM